MSDKQPDPPPPGERSVGGRRSPLPKRILLVVVMLALATTAVVLTRSQGATAGVLQTVVPGRTLASQCAQCHGPDSGSVGDIDSLAGSEATDLYDKLIDMKHGGDSNIMHLQARGYTDEQLRLIADYYATLPKPGEDDDD